MLPFPKPEKTRKFSCFVCGRMYENIDEFKSHIIEKHEVERDYIICPIVHCQMPVRDLKAHYKAKHPHLNATPPVTLEKATVWRDYNEKKGKRVLKPKFRSGEFFSSKNGREFHYRSGLECQLLEILEQVPQVKKYHVEPFKIDYIFEGKHHEYTPDLSVLYEGNHIEIMEVKPSNQTALEINKAKWAAAEGFCKSRGWNFTVITEQGINKLKKRLKS